MSVLEATPKSTLFPEITKINWSEPVDYSTIYIPTPSTTDPTQFKGLSSTISMLDEIEMFKSFDAKVNEINKQFTAVNNAIAAASSTVQNLLAAAAFSSPSELDDTIPQAWIDGGHDIVDKERAATLLREVASSVPDGHFDSRKAQKMPNVYFVGDMGACIIGRMFERLGYTHDDLTYHGYDGEPITNAVDPALSNDLLNTGSVGRVYPSNMRITPAAHWMLQQAQIDNDQGAAWTRIAEQATV